MASALNVLVFTNRPSVHTFFIEPPRHTEAELTFASLPITASMLARGRLDLPGGDQLRDQRESRRQQQRQRSSVQPAREHDNQQPAAWRMAQREPGEHSDQQGYDVLDQPAHSLGLLER
jgi:hypothetical protein